MDMSDGDDQQQSVVATRKRFRPDDVLIGLGTSTSCNDMDAQHLRDENNTIRCQMEAYKNEVDVIRVEMQTELNEKDKQLKILQQTLQNVQQQLLDSKRKQSEDEIRMKELQNKLKGDQQVVYIRDDDVISERCDSGTGLNPSVDLTDNCSTISVSSALTMTENEAKLVGIISTFLNVHPFGAGLDYIWSYVSKLESSIRPSDLELLMSKFPAVFSQKLVGIGANIERRWLFIAFNKSI